MSCVKMTLTFRYRDVNCEYKLLVKWVVSVHIGCQRSPLLPRYHGNESEVGYEVGPWTQGLCEVGGYYLL